MKKKVVIIVKYFYPIERPSGISSFVYELARLLARQADLSIISVWREENTNQEYQHNGYTIYKVRAPFPLSAPFLARKFKPDVVIIFSGVYQPIKTMLYFWPISFLLGRVKRIFCQATNYNVKNLPRFYAYFLKQFDEIIATNQLLQEQYQALGLTCKQITPGVNISHLSQQSFKKVAKDKDVRVGFFGHFYKNKGVDRLISAFLKLGSGNTELLLAGGPGPQLDMAKKIAEKNAEIKVLWQANNIFPYISSCDLVVLPYRSSAAILGISQSALEAMSLSIPVIGTKTPSLEYLIKDGYNGYLVKDDVELVEKLRLLIENPNQRRRLGDNARLTIEENFSIQKIADQYLKLIYGNG